MSHHLAPEDALVLGEPQVDAGSARLQVRQLWQEAVDSAEHKRELLLFDSKQHGLSDAGAVAVLHGVHELGKLVLSANLSSSRIPRLA